jgi:ribosomal-protein-alanine N-acetyltransferase
MKTSVSLASLTSKDEAAFLAAVAGSRAIHHPWVSPPRTPGAFRALVARMKGPTNYGFLVRLDGSEQLVGFIEVTNVVRGVFRSAYLGYYAFAGHERQGHMKQALAQAIRKAFSELKLHRLEANIQPENLASVALVRSCGFVKEGYSERYLKIRGRWRDHERWAILAR